MEIVEATIKDLKDIQELNNKLFTLEVEKYDDTLDPNWAFSKDGTKFFTSIIEDENKVGFIAKNNNKVVGYLAGSCSECPNFRTVGKLAELENMYICEECRGSGIGSKLMGAFVKWCKSKEVQRIRVLASTKNKNAIKFYNKMGYSELEVYLEKPL